MDTELLEQTIEKYLSLSFARSGGPGGQNVNKVNTKVTAKLALSDLDCLTETERDRLRQKLKNRLNHLDQIVIQVQEKRSQVQNRLVAVTRMQKLIQKALCRPKKRRPTRPSRAARERRLQLKKLQSKKKQQRREFD